VTKNTKNKTIENYTKEAEMKTKRTLLAIIFSSMYAIPSGAQMLVGDKDMEVIEIKGLRGNAISSTDAKRVSSQVSDSISSTEIGKFPDTNIGDSLQRIPGIQISRNRGEAESIAIRGLDEVATLLNGRNYFGGGTDSSVKRAASLEDIPPVIVKSIDVYKSATADQVEGGIGGVVDIQRQQASDFTELTFVTSIKAQYGDLTDKWSPTISALVADSWELSDDNGNLSAMVAASYQSREFREDSARAFNRNVVTEESAGEPVPQDTLFTTGFNNVPAWGDRERTVVNGSVVWKPNDKLSFFVEGGYTDFSDIQSFEELSFKNFETITDIDTSNVTSARTFANSISYEDMTMDVLSQISGRETQTYDIAMGFEIATGNIEYSGEVSIVNTNNDGTGVSEE
jgi:TonB-dependent receptor